MNEVCFPTKSRLSNGLKGVSMLSDVTFIRNPEWPSKATTIKMIKTPKLSDLSEGLNKYGYYTTSNSRVAFIRAKLSILYRVSSSEQLKKQDAGLYSEL
jgi:hypothetical protein